PTRRSSDLVRTHDGERDADSSADQGKQQAFHQQLTSDAPTAGADGGSNGDFTLTAGGTRQKQAGNIRARNQQDERNGAEQDQQGRTELAGNLITQGDNVDAPVSVKIGILVFK